MARIRTIKPSFFRHHDLYNAELAANAGRIGKPHLNIRLAFSGLTTAADREGRFKWRPDELKLDCLPYDPIDFSEVMAALANAPEPFIVRYEAPGGPFGWIIHFKEHQRPHPAEAKSTFPEPPSEVQLKFNRTSNDARKEVSVVSVSGKGTEVSVSKKPAPFVDKSGDSGDNPLPAPVLNGDPSSAMKCEHLNSPAGKAAISEAFLKRPRMPAIDSEPVLKAWAQVNKELVTYHAQRTGRGLPCDWTGCVKLPAAAIKDMSRAKSNPIAYLREIFRDAMPKEEDRQAGAKAAAAKKRPKGKGPIWA